MRKSLLNSCSAALKKNIYKEILVCFHKPRYQIRLREKKCMATNAAQMNDDYDILQLSIKTKTSAVSNFFSFPLQWKNE